MWTARLHGITTASSYSIGGVIFGKLLVCTPTLFCWQWPEGIRSQVILFDNPASRIMNLDLEMTGLLLLWLAMEGVCGPLLEKCIALFGDNSSLIGWVAHLASKQSLIAENLIQAMALCLKIQQACPLTPIHIKGKCNAISDIPSHSFGSNPTLKCNKNIDLLTLINPLFSLPAQKSWTVFRLNCKVVMRMTSALWTKPFDLAEWRQLPKVGRHIGKIGAPISNLWGWIHT
jgi:hypothetical protein